MKVKCPIDFVLPVYMKGVDWKRLKKELELPSKQFWGLQWLKQRRAEKRARFEAFHQANIEAGYKYKEKNGVYYYWKKKKE